MSGILVGGDVMGFSWSGVLGATDLAAVYDRCGALRLTGLLELVDGAKRAQVVFVGGEAVETRGVGEAEVRAWRHGSFHLTQRVPDLSGALTDGIRLEGELRHEPPRDLIRNCQDTRLTAALEFARRTGGKAEVRFAHGRVESVVIDGRSELGALGQIGGWLDGRYTLTLRPLFTDDAPVAPPERTRAEPGQLFDFTSQVALPETVGAKRSPTPSRSSSVARPSEVVLPARERTPELLATLPIGNHGLPSVLPPPPEIPEEYSHPGLGADLDDKTAITREPRALREADQLTSMTRLPSSSERPRGRRDSRWLPMAMIGVVVFALAAAATVLIAPRVGEEKARSRSEEHAAAAAPAATTTEERQPPATPPRPSPTAKSDHGERSSAELARIAEGQRALIEGHARAALGAFRAARRIAPHDALLGVLDRMARGKTGHGELILDGDGALTVDGHRFTAPARLKLPAGPHVVGEGDRASEVTLRKGEERHLSAE